MSQEFVGMSRSPGGVQKVCAKKVRALFCSLNVSPKHEIQTCEIDMTNPDVGRSLSTEEEKSPVHQKGSKCAIPSKN